MKKYSFLYLTILASAFTSCSNEELTDNVKGAVDMTFYATHDSAVGTRTAIDTDDNALWSEGDAISVFDAASANNKFTLSAGAGTVNGTFTGKVNTSSEQWFAIYPYNTDATISGNTISGVTMPAQQVAKAGQLDTQAYLLSATSTNTQLAFKQATCLIELTTTVPCKKIVFKTNGTENLTGTISMTIGEDGIASCNVTANASKTVTLVPASNSTTIPAGTYHFCILPQTLAQGFTVEAFKAEAEAKLVKSTETSVNSFTRGKIVNLGTTEGWSEVHYCDHYYEFGKGTKEYVDLGLPSGLKWATCNLGAMEPWEYGDFYSWGATEPWLQSYHMKGVEVTKSIYCLWNDYHKSYDWGNAPYNNSGSANLSNGKYWTKYTGGDSSFSADGADPADLAKTVLDPEDDAAHVQWGADWRMPTSLELQELKDNTYWVWTTNFKQTGIKGCIVYQVKDASHKGKLVSSDVYGYSVESDNYIFLPTTAAFGGSAIYDSGIYGYYWSSSLFTDYPSDSRYMYFNNTGINPQYHGRRFHGFTVRPVHAN